MPGLGSARPDLYPIGTAAEQEELAEVLCAQQLRGIVAVSAARRA
jgi:hypothetical protein